MMSTRHSIPLLCCSRWPVGLSCFVISTSSLYSKLRTSPLDTGLEQVYTCSMRLLNMPGKAYFFHPARPIKKARTSLAPFLSGSDHERVALRAPQYKGTRAQEPCVQRGAFLMWYAGIDWANDHHDALVIDEQGVRSVRCVSITPRKA